MPADATLEARMPRLILIKHASPLVVPGEPAHRWRLSEQGRAACVPLAEALRNHAPAVIVSSTEPKAVETAELVAAHLAIPHETASDLHEHDRSNVPHMRSGEFISMMELMFRKPDQLVLGRETARQAQQRFSRAVESVINRHKDRDLAIVSHGTVIALFVAQHSATPAFQLWRTMQLPSFVVMEHPGWRVVDTTASIRRPD
ncbi:histidine phosphatase family protein [Fontivita pretiosa]|uniref:histidine phosphatase family protein n=1 Tax=Fontivita pretiosa TaxID=2989684 RepID=UPI003D179A68